MIIAVVGAMVSDVCGCCNVCAKLEGERCGGVWDMYGTCAPGLKCKHEKCWSKNKGEQTSVLK